VRNAIGIILTVVSGGTLIITAFLFFIDVIDLGQAVYSVIITSVLGLIMGAILWAL